MVTKRVNSGHSVAKESGVGILDHMFTKCLNSENGVAKESGVGILGHMLIKGVNSGNSVAKESGVGRISWATWLLKELRVGMVWPRGLELASW
eukprot:6708304-Karenia_brevis.AAC.1